MSKESSKVQMVFAYHYKSFANNKPVYWDEFQEMKESLYQSYTDSVGHYPSISDKNEIHSKYIRKTMREHWDVYLYLPLLYS